MGQYGHSIGRLVLAEAYRAPQSSDPASAKTVNRKPSELRNYWRYLQSHEIVPEDLPEKLQSAQVRAAARSPLSALFEDLPSLDELERRYLLYILDVAGGNRTRAAEILRVDRRTLYRMIERYGIDSNGK